MSAGGLRQQQLAGFGQRQIDIDAGIAHRSGAGA